MAAFTFQLLRKGLAQAPLVPVALLTIVVCLAWPSRTHSTSTLAQQPALSLPDAQLQLKLFRMPQFTRYGSLAYAEVLGWQPALSPDSALHPLTGRVVLYADSALLTQAAVGSVLVATGSLRPIASIKAEGYRSYLQSLGVSHQFSAERLHSTSKPLAMSALRLELVKRVLRSFKPPAQGLAATLLLGHRGLLASEAKAAFREAGAAHVLAISGLHVSIVLSLFSVLLLGRSRRGLAWKVPFLLLLLGGFALLTGGSVSVLRASLMSAVALLALPLRRRYYGWNSLALAALALLVIHPAWVYDLGFQLSFAAVAGILLWRPLLEGLVPTPWRLTRWVWDVVWVSLAATLATLPLTLYHFGTLPLYFLLANLLILPAMGLVLGLGLAWLVLGSLPGIGALLTWLLTQLLTFLHASASLVAGLPGAVLEFSLGLWPAIGLAVLLTGLPLWLHARRQRLRHSPQEAPTRPLLV